MMTLSVGFTAHNLDLTWLNAKCKVEKYCTHTHSSVRVFVDKKTTAHGLSLVRVFVDKKTTAHGLSLVRVFVDKKTTAHGLSLVRVFAVETRAGAQHLGLLNHRVVDRRHLRVGDAVGVSVATVIAKL
jgi:hypothetical protein